MFLLSVQAHGNREHVAHQRRVTMYVSPCACECVSVTMYVCVWGGGGAVTGKILS
jgi:hypothetical protein